jgi:hypothetical protein
MSIDALSNDVSTRKEKMPMSKPKAPSDKSSTLASKVLRSKTATKDAKSLAGAVLSLDPKKGPRKK